MSWVHIVTVGISLALKMEKAEGTEIGGRDLEDRLRKMSESAKGWYRKRLLRFIEQMEEKGRITEVCAELNALSRMMNEVGLVYLVHTDTESGRCCAEALRAFLKSRGINSRIVKVKGLGRVETFQIGLSNLARRIAELVARHRGNVRICATGGFKPETVIASIIGFIARAPVYYIHEAFREEVHLPALPLTWRIKPGQREAISRLLEAGEEGVNKQKLKKALGYQTVKKLLENWLIEEAEDKYKPTKVTKAILEAIQILS